MPVKVDPKSLPTFFLLARSCRVSYIAIEGTRTRCSRFFRDFDTFLLWVFLPLSLFFGRNKDRKWERFQGLLVSFVTRSCRKSFFQPQKWRHCDLCVVSNVFLVVTTLYDPIFPGTYPDFSPSSYTSFSLAFSRVRTLEIYSKIQMECHHIYIYYNVKQFYTNTLLDNNVRRMWNIS